MTYLGVSCHYRNLIISLIFIWNCELLSWQNKAFFFSQIKMSYSIQLFKNLLTYNGYNLKKKKKKTQVEHALHHLEVIYSAKLCWQSTTSRALGGCSKDWKTGLSGRTHAPERERKHLAVTRNQSRVWQSLQEKERLSAVDFRGW